VRQVLCPVLVGRDPHLQAIAAGVDAAALGRGTAWFVTGEAGVGKSRLAREAATAATARGVVVLVARAVQGRTTDPYRPITEALMSVLRSSGLPRTADLAPFRSALGRVVPEWRGGGIVESGESSAVLGEGVLRLLAALSKGSGVLLVLEDLHWADPEWVQVLEYVADNLGAQPVCVLPGNAAVGAVGTGPRSRTGAGAAT
jgi:predicted ATPase